MFEKGEYVIYGSNGICHVEDIVHMNMAGVDKNQLYYMLVPLQMKESKIYIPIDNEKIRIRKALNSQEAAELIDGILNIDAVSVKDEKQREEMYKELMGKGQPQDWICIIKTLYIRRQERSSQGKKITATDEKYLRMAENNLYSELSFALGIKKEDMEGYIIDRVNALGKNE